MTFLHACEKRFHMTRLVGHILMEAHISGVFIIVTGRLRVYRHQADIGNIIICILDGNKSEPIYHNDKQISDDSLIL